MCTVLPLIELHVTSMLGLECYMSFPVVDKPLMKRIYVFIGLHLSG